MEQEDRNREIEEAYSNQYNRDPYDNSDNNNNYNNNNNDYTRSNNAPSNNNYGRGSAAYPNQPPYGPYPVNNFDMRPDSYNFYPWLFKILLKNNIFVWRFLLKSRLDLFFLI